MDSFNNATRHNTGVLAAAERRVLVFLAERLPARIHSDHLTALALLSMLMVGVSFAVSSHRPLALGWVVVWLTINWLGDSLDGTLARVRNHQRPRYGFYIDHIFDSFGAVFVLGGLALSGWMTPLLAAGVLVAYFLLSIEIYLATYCVGRFEMSHWGLGATELRILVAIGSLWLFVKPVVTIAGRHFLLFDVGGAAAVVGMVATAVTATVRHVRTLYKAEPVREVSPPGTQVAGTRLEPQCDAP